MRFSILLLFFTVTSISCFAQGKVDLSNAPVAGSSINTPKSNATLLKETTPIHKNEKDNLSEKYKATDKTSGTFRTVKQNDKQPNMLQTAGQETMNGTSQKINLGGGTKAKSTTYFDNEGKVRGTNTTISFDK